MSEETKRVVYLILALPPLIALVLVLELTIGFKP